MRSLRYHCLLILLLTTTLKFERTLAGETEESATETNEIIPREAIEKLDFSVRQALLRAIDKLEQEEKQKPNTAETTTELSTEPTTTPDSSSKDEILDESVPADDVVPTVQFFTATLDEKATHEQPLYSFIDRSKAIKKYTKLHRPTNLGAPVVVAEPDSQQQDNHQTARSVGGSSVRSNEISSEQSDEIKFEIRSSKKTGTTVTTTTTTSTTTARPRTTTKRKPTTTTTTTTTTPRPTHNEDGENIEVVDKQDIKIQEAPLVTAFTVNLDERGTAKQVVPIIHAENSNVPRHRGPTITKLSVLPAGSQALIFPTAPPTPATQQTTQHANLLTTTASSVTLQPTNQLITEQKTSPNVNNFLIERQRQLEQQIYQLKLQAQQQQELILRQLKILEQQTQLQPKLLANNQANIAQQNQQLQVPATLQQQQQQQQQQNRANAPDLGFTIRPSVEFLPSTHTNVAQTLVSTFPAEQQLPLTDFPNKFNNNFNSNVTPNTVLPPIQTQQQLPLNNPVRQIFHNLQNLQGSQPHHVTAAPTNLAPTTVQIQPSNQFSFTPTFAPALQPPKPLELSDFQSLPQHNFQQFQQSPLVPSYVTSAIFQQQQQQQQRQQQQQQQQEQQQQHQQQPNQQQHHRFFRQETGTGNFGVNQVQIQSSNSFTLPDLPLQQQTLDNQNFYRQNLVPQLSNQLQQNAQQYYQQQQQQKSAAALNHGINGFGAQNLRFNGANGF